ncbi:bifunctional glutamate N-acetyltransferase/amino-acid acetyltransferase ArgJ [Acuticoccus sp. I52.16.1]|uniref:bifunctional glutamate N-acetyltransferase/amino-acid acetyltransferase ArgJ n=1 Tax=Acuticoccus sp. I52.16.1 TaxID=2928472 RepID=UPI001FD27325|nr:bifunctional glutamate N-acetyltransferase/amino-acid acetyltransferase ArgJ [Acuticoccus sp. I52.16.1]UOM33214.1 bifunctional glutamate N-acetyltransferase/amino-acid acetyltransferase ArgJ [Acuticoccus sp. I52.16.1]
MTPSPFAPAHLPEPPAVAGVRLATAEAGIKYRGRTDVLLMAFDEGTTVAGVFTTSRCPSAPVEWCRAQLARGTARALLVNSGNANAFTGKKGRAATSLSADLAAQALGIAAEDVFLASTGVIGEPLPAERFGAVMEGAAARLTPGGWADAARAIMTTDTFPKAESRTVALSGGSVTITGIAKGAGMIAPDMATMLSFVATDAAIPAPDLQAMLSAGVGKSFNKVTIDSDTSTSDTVLLFATGASGVAVAGEDALRFAAALDDLLLALAHWVTKDGEGCTKFVSITVEGAESDASANKIAKSIADSPLVKTAIAGEDANWGRIVMAVGKAGEPADRDRLAIWFDDVRVAVEGERDPAYSEAAASAVMQKPEIAIRVDLGLGSGRDTVWTCDLTKEYVAINGDYRS